MRLVFDIETNPIDFSIGNHIDQVENIWCIVALDIDSGQEHIWHINPDGSTDGVEDFLNLLREADELIGHNIIQFDLPALRKVFGYLPKGQLIRDTLVTSRVLYPDRPGGHSLGAWGERLGEYKQSFNRFERYSPEMLAYCRQDVAVNARIHERFIREAGDYGWEKALRLEHRIAEIIGKQEQKGFCFDQEKAEGYVNEWTDRINDIDSELRPSNRSFNIGTVSRPFKISGDPSQICEKVCASVDLSPSDISGPFSGVGYRPLDLNSKQQQKEFLLESGWKPESFTPTGQPKLDDSILKVEKIGPLIHERNVLSHRLGQVQGLIDCAKHDGRVHGGANPCGTPTGRMRHSRIVNIPRVTSPYGKELRSLFKASENWILGGYDAASLELRILAHYIGNPEYTQSVTSTDKRRDAHTLAAQAAGTDNRDTGKTINYALIYGAGDYKLGQIVGAGKEKGKEIRKTLYKNIPGLEQLIKQVERASRKGFLIGLDGRKIFLRDKKSALNALIQSGGAVFMKTVTEVMDDLWLFEGFGHKVVDMHDEAQWELDKDFKEIFEQCVNSSFEIATEELQLRCPQQAEVKFGKDWSETH